MQLLKIETIAHGYVSIGHTYLQRATYKCTKVADAKSKI